LLPIGSNILYFDPLIASLGRISRRVRRSPTDASPPTARDKIVGPVGQKGNMHMTMREGERWICSNPTCGCEVLVVLSAGDGDGTNPRCSCGFTMRKRYTAPKLRLLEGKDLHEKSYSKVS